MVASSESNDSADVFWPGYVDAISNLAINLLFVIAVMAIVVLGATLQINELLKRKNNRLADEVAFVELDKGKKLPGSGKVDPASNTTAQSEAQRPNTLGITNKNADSEIVGQGLQKNQTITLEPSKQEQQKEQQQKDQKIKEQSEQLQQLQQQLLQTVTQLNKAKSTLAKTQSSAATQGADADTKTDLKRVETVTASNVTPAPDGKNTAIVVQGGVIVNFNPNVTLLTEAEVHDVIEKMATFAPIKTSKWSITVISPKGFSEALRLGFYRASIVRNALLQSGVDGANIDMRVHESTQASANNARVIIRPAS